MRVRVNETMKVFHGHVPTQLAEGQEVSGELAAMLLERAAAKVTRLDAEPDEDGGDGGPKEPPASLADASTAAEVLAWVGEDPDRAAEALAVEEAAEKPRSTLVKQLKKLAEG
ncbi:hypothetical protein SGFS_012950 [Streptomyces graminofaciens]|uniref:Uncharacterized protein n=1 Tax=Streptomyces graminofaciens TaxID=68212 RepID=A0ABM9SBS2_9ACTN|nr:hypothetical protein [Streptomyces graminofaciens]BBC30001.1 hypothetical protein SGFS_012950 [Streptomyces graminofaciens]